MSRKLFTEEQISILRQNPYVYSVSPSVLALTKEFKEIFCAQYQEGKSPRTILEDHGFSIDIIGERRVWGISQHIRSEYLKYGEFHQGYQGRKQRHSSDIPVQLSSDADRLSQLQHEVNYLKQEVEFLKKISSIRTTRK